MKSLWLIGYLTLLVGCAHRTPFFSVVPGNGPITGEMAVEIGKQVAMEREGWKRVDCDVVANKPDGWKVWVARVPIRLHGPWALVILDEYGQVKTYKQLKYE